MNASASAPDDRRSPAPVLLISDDLFLLPRLEDAVRAAGLSPVVVDTPASLGAEGDPVPRRVPVTEPLEGSDAAFMRSVVDDPPALIIFDLNASTLPWARWLQVLKTSSATRRLPVLAFGPHVEEAALEEARRLGADRVVTRGQLSAGLPEILRESARTADAAGIERGCVRPASPEAQRGIGSLLSGLYFEAHEHLERAILDDPGEEGSVYRPLLHLAVACLHIERGNWRGAQKMLLRMRPWLAPLPARCRGVDVDSLRAALATLQERLDAWREGGDPPAVPFPPPHVEFRPIASGAEADAP